MPNVQAIRVSCHLFYSIKETLHVEMNRDKEREVSPVLPIQYLVFLYLISLISSTGDIL